MPQASEKLRAKFPGGDREARDVLQANFTISRKFIIEKKQPTYNPTSREWDAVDFLIFEWDYGYSVASVKKHEPTFVWLVEREFIFSPKFVPTCVTPSATKDEAETKRKSLVRPDRYVVTKYVRVEEKR